MKTFFALMLVLLAAPAVAQDPALAQYASRVEIYSIPTLTISDADFLKGDASHGKRVAVGGELRVAQGRGRTPAVVLVHGSSGVGPNVELWVRDLNAMGISTFVIDGFTGRGLTVVGPDQALLGRLNLVLDAYRALDILAKHPRIDASRIVMMGFSRGGQATLFASVKRFNELWNTSGVEFAAHIPFYPDCSTTYLRDTELTRHPVRIFHGTPDDYNPVASCRAYVERLKAAGNDVELTEYPNAQHAFDNPLGAATPAVSRNAQTVRNCRIREEAPGDLVNTATRQRFQYGDACVERDPHTGRDPEATAAARRAVAEFLRSVGRP
jgi:Dienelactone hydrolase and related enzymes